MFSIAQRSRKLTCSQKRWCRKQLCWPSVHTQLYSWLWLSKHRLHTCLWKWSMYIHMYILHRNWFYAPIVQISQDFFKYAPTYACGVTANESSWRFQNIISEHLTANVNYQTSWCDVKFFFCYETSCFGAHSRVCSCLFFLHWWEAWGQHSVPPSLVCIQHSKTMAAL